MPSLYTHNYFTNDLYNRIKENKKIHNINNPLYLNIFTQSFDNLFYYNFLSIKPGKKYRTLGHYAHVHESWEYFKNIIEYTKKHKLYDDENLGYLYGSISHYNLDSTAHPYIHYISGRFSRSDFKGTKQYRGNHAVNEINIDAIYYYKNHTEKYYKYKMYKEIIPITKFSDSLLKNMDNAFEKTFSYKNIGKIYNSSYNQSHYIYKFLMYDRFNIKRCLYKVVDFIYRKKIFMAYSYSHHIDKPNYNLMNLKHNTWYHPITNEKHTESFEDLYETAMKKTIKSINKINDYFNNKCGIDDVKKVVGNYSYSSGLDCNIRKRFKYFKI